MTTQQIKATIRSNEQITLEDLDKFTESISYEKVNEVKFHDMYYTVIHIVVDADAAKEFVEEYYSTEPEEDRKEWTGNIWDFFEDGPVSRMSEDYVIPASVDWWNEVEFEYY